MKAAASGGTPDVRPRAGTTAGRSTRVSLRVLETAPMTPAVAAICTGLLNMTEKPKTPTKLMAARSSVRMGIERPSGWKSSGARPTTSATSQPMSVASTMTAAA